MRHPYTRGLFDSIPLPGADKNARPLVADPRPAAAAAPAAAGLLISGRAARYFVAGRLRRRARSRWMPVDEPRVHAARCRPLRRDRLGGGRADGASRREPTPPGDVVLEVDDLNKYYEIDRQLADAMFARRKAAHGQGQRAARFRRPRGARRSRSSAKSGCGKSTFAKVMMGLETATEGEITLNGNRTSRATRRSQKRGARPSPATCRWCSRTPSTR